MGTAFEIKRNSTYRSLRMTLSNDSPNPDANYADLTEVLIFLQQVHGTGGNQIDGKPGVIEDKVTNPKAVKIRYDFDPEDVNKSGTYQGYVLGRNDAGREERFPSKGYFTVIINVNFEG